MKVFKMNINEIKDALDCIINKGVCEKELSNNNLTVYLRSEYKGSDCYNVTCDLYLSDTAIIKDMVLFISIKEGECLKLYSDQLPLLINDHLKQKMYQLEQAIITIDY